jgi:hypothetical protein
VAANQGAPGHQGDLVNAMMRLFSTVAGAVVISATALDCTAVPAPGDSITPHSGALIGGSPSDPEYAGVVRVVADVECSGFLITNQWAITARHCISSVLAGQPQQIIVLFGGTRAQPAQTATVTEVQRSAPGPDLALLRLSVPLNVNGAPSGYLQREYPQSNFIQNQSLACTGWGSVAAQSSPPNIPNTVGLLLESITPPLLGLGPSSTGQQAIATGDAGGPCRGDLRDLQAAVGLIGGVFTTGAGAAIDLTPVAIRSWMESTLVQVDPDVPAQAVSIPHAVSPDGQQINIFWVDDLGRMNQSQVSPDALPVVVGMSEDDPFAVARPAAAYVQGDLHILGRTVSGRVLEGVSSGGVEVSKWTPVAALPAISSGLGIVSRSAGEFDVFAHSMTGPVIHAWFSGGDWVSSEVIGGSFDADVLAVWSYSQKYGGTIHAFGISPGHIGHKWGTEVVGWQPAGDEWLYADVTGNVSSAIATVQFAEFTMDLFARGTNGHLVHKGYAVGWGDQFADLGVAIPGEPTAVVAGGAIHIFARNPSGSLWHAHFPR